MYSEIQSIILWVSWLFLIITTIYIIARGKAVLKLIKGSIIGKLAMGLMVGFFIESYSVLFLCSVLIVSSKDNIGVVLPIYIIWLATFIGCWMVMHRSRIDAEKIVKG